MYNNLLSAMKSKNVTFTQIADLLGCRYQTVSDNIQGSTERGIYFDDAKKYGEYFSLNMILCGCFVEKKIVLKTNLCSIKQIYHYRI